MFNRLPQEITLHALSFLSDRALSICASATQVGLDHNEVNISIKNRMNNFDIGRDRFKSLCLMNQAQAQLGIDIDSTRSRYHLLQDDICDIALMSEEMARYILVNARLQRSGRLNGSFPIVICNTFPNLAVELFSQKNISLPNSEEIIDIITQHPDFFGKLSANTRFIRLINHSEILVKLSLINETIALDILAR